MLDEKTGDDTMAVKNLSIALKNCQVYEEDGVIYLEEFSRDGSSVYILNDILNSFSGDDRFFDLTIREKVTLQGSGGS